MKKDFKIKLINKDKAILENEQKGKNLVWPVDELPAGIKEGDDIILTINKIPPDREEGKILAKNILNEILDIQEQ
jgi:hypothetical protein